MASPIRLMPRSTKNTPSGGASDIGTPAATLDAWLDELELGAYASAMRDAGYSSLRFLRAAAREDLEEMLAHIQMKKPHARVFLSAWAELAGATPAPIEEAPPLV